VTKLQSLSSEGKHIATTMRRHSRSTSGFEVWIALKSKLYIMIKNQLLKIYKIIQHALWISSLKSLSQSLWLSFLFLLPTENRKKLEFLAPRKMQFPPYSSTPWAMPTQEIALLNLSALILKKISEVFQWSILRLCQCWSKRCYLQCIRDTNRGQISFYDQTQSHV